MTELSEDRLITLANGARVPFGAAVAAYDLLESHLQDQNLEWDGVYHLREICLGNTIEREPMQTLIREGLLESDGSVNPALSEVVLAAVRGQNRLLYLDSPFTNPLDQKLAEYINARDYLQDFQQTQHESAGIPRNDGDEPADIPETLRDPNTFFQRLLDRMERDPTSLDPTGEGLDIQKRMLREILKRKEQNPPSDLPPH